MKSSHHPAGRPRLAGVGFVLAAAALFAGAAVLLGGIVLAETARTPPSPARAAVEPDAGDVPHGAHLPEGDRVPLAPDLPPL